MNTPSQCWNQSSTKAVGHVGERPLHQNCQAWATGPWKKPVSGGRCLSLPQGTLEWSGDNYGWRKEVHSWEDQPVGCELCRWTSFIWPGEGRSPGLPPGKGSTLRRHKESPFRAEGRGERCQVRAQHALVSLLSEVSSTEPHRPLEPPPPTHSQPQSLGNLVGFATDSLSVAGT